MKPLEFRPSLSRRTFFGWFAAGLALVASCAAPHVRPQGEVRLVVLHTNDMHGQVLPRRGTWIDKNDPPLVGGLPRVAGYVAQVRREEAARGADVLVLDGGDWYQGTPEGVIELGLPMVRAIAAIDYDAASLGNHEFDHGVANVKRLLSEARPAAVCANLREPESGERVAWVEPYRIVERAGLRIALVGLLTPETPSITHPDARALVFADPVEELVRVKRELAGRYDLMIPVGHIGVEDGARIVRAHPEIPLVVTGHSHTFLKEGQREGRGLIVQAGAKASVVGRVELSIDGPSAGVLASSARLVDLLADPTPQDRNARVEELCADLAQRADLDMRRTIGELAGPLKAGRGPLSTVAGNWVADMLRERVGGDVGIHNRGGTRAEIDAGPVTVREVFEMLPFDNDVVLLELPGADLAEVVRGAIEGTTHSGLDYSGMRVFVKSRSEGGKTLLTLERIEIGGKPLDPAASYRVATNSFLAGGGDGFAEFARAKRSTQDPILMRELAAEVLERAGTLTPPSEARIVDLTAESQP
ncbi:MAG: bifunctional metallophosphatase/5'-nucleotidase [Planctomycetes bacterium]|nr:bifunctional metallophosphatase/5'-nucleotidase [Planctomycetota bacterium]